MKLDRTFAAELKKANGDGSREARFSFLKTARSAARELSSTEAPYIFGDVLRRHGRAAVGACVAATAIARADRLEPETVRWAREVLRVWTNKVPSNLESLIINDGPHPCRIECYAGSLIACAVEEW